MDELVKLTKEWLNDFEIFKDKQLSVDENSLEGDAYFLLNDWLTREKQNKKEMKQWKKQ